MATLDDALRGIAPARAAQLRTKFERIRATLPKEMQAAFEAQFLRKVREHDLSEASSDRESVTNAKPQKPAKSSPQHKEHQSSPGKRHAGETVPLAHEDPLSQEVQQVLERGRARARPQKRSPGAVNLLPASLRTGLQSTKSFEKQPPPISSPSVASARTQSPFSVSWFFVEHRIANRRYTIAHNARRVSRSGSGKVTIEEFRVAIQESGIRMEESQVEDLVHLLACSVSGGMVSISGFLGTLRSRFPRDRTEADIDIDRVIYRQIKQRRLLLDRSFRDLLDGTPSTPRGSGSAPVAEVAAAGLQKRLSTNGVELSTEQAERLVLRFDVHGAGRCNLTELASYLEVEGEKLERRRSFAGRPKSALGIESDLERDASFASEGDDPLPHPHSATEDVREIRRPLPRRAADLPSDTDSAPEEESADGLRSLSPAPSSADSAGEQEDAMLEETQSEGMGIRATQDSDAEEEKAHERAPARSAQPARRIAVVPSATERSAEFSKLRERVLRIEGATRLLCSDLEECLRILDGYAARFAQ